MPATRSTKRPAYIAIPAPDKRLLDELNFALTIVECDLSNTLENVVSLDYDPESGLYPALAFAALSKLLVDLKFAPPVPEPVRPEPALALPFLGTVFAGDPPAKKAVKRKPKALTTAGGKPRFDFATLPPRVEAGC